jgi:AP-3 complex subunit beta
MTDLEAIGSNDVQQALASGAGLESKLNLEDPRASAFDAVYRLIAGQQPGASATAMKMLLALMSKGHNVVEFSPFVIQQLASGDHQTKQLASVFLTHYAETDPETAMLSINTFQRLLTESDPIIRARAVKSMSSVRLVDSLPAIQDAINKVIGDASPYVKKAAAFAMIKACELEPNEIESYLPLVDRLLGDQSPIAFSGAITAYWTLCPDNIDMIHPHFRYICQNISKFDSYAQVFALRALTIYARYCFKNPATDTADESAAGFWDDSGHTDVISSDHLMLIHAARRCLSSLSPAVVIAAVSLLFYCGSLTHLIAVAKPLIRLLYETPAVAEMSLLAIVPISTAHQDIFLPHLNHFFVRKADTLRVKQLKIKILSQLATSEIGRAHV